MKCDACRSRKVVRCLVTVILTAVLAAVPAQAANDDVLRARIEEQARSDHSLEGTQVVVRVQSRDVILSGTVRLYLQKIVYEQIAWHTQGVRDVENEIRVVPVLPTTDAAIKQVILAFLIENDEITSTSPEVTVTNGHVVLRAMFSEPGDVLVLKRRVAEIEGVVDIDIHATFLA